jgi:hypothetical protein
MKWAMGDRSIRLVLMAMIRKQRKDGYTLTIMGSSEEVDPNCSTSGLYSRNDQYQFQWDTDYPR